jgi:hypothetical protein
VSATLEQLEGKVWEPPQFHSQLVTTCLALRKKPLSDFTVEDLRIMIGQNIGLPYLIPHAISVLKNEPLAEGDYYPGDLLENVVRTDPKFFASNPTIASEVVNDLQSCFAIDSRQ